MNKIVGVAVLLSYPKFREWFIIHTDYSKTSLGGFKYPKWEAH